MRCQQPIPPDLRPSRGAVILAGLLCVGLLTSATGWGVLEGFSGVMRSVQHAFWLESGVGGGDRGPVLAFLGGTTKSQNEACGTDVVCPACVVVRAEAAAAVIAGSCTQHEDGISSGTQQCAQQQLDARSRRWVKDGRCYPGCTAEAESLCTDHRRLLRGTAAHLVILKSCSL